MKKLALILLHFFLLSCGNDGANNSINPPVEGKIAPEEKIEESEAKEEDLLKLDVESYSVKFPDFLNEQDELHLNFKNELLDLLYTYYTVQKDIESLTQFMIQYRDQKDLLNNTIIENSNFTYPFEREFIYPNSLYLLGVIARDSILSNFHISDNARSAFYVLLNTSSNGQPSFLFAPKYEGEKYLRLLYSDRPIDGFVNYSSDRLPSGQEYRELSSLLYSRLLDTFNMEIEAELFKQLSEERHRLDEISSNDVREESLEPKKEEHRYSKSSPVETLKPLSVKEKTLAERLSRIYSRDLFEVISKIPSENLQFMRNINEVVDPIVKFYIEQENLKERPIGIPNAADWAALMPSERNYEIYLFFKRMGVRPNFGDTERNSGILAQLKDFEKGTYKEKWYHDAFSVLYANEAPRRQSRKHREMTDKYANRFPH